MQASQRAAATAPRSLLKECLEAARRGQNGSSATGSSSSGCPPVEPDAGFLAGLEVASIVAHGGGSIGSRSATPGGTVASASGAPFAAPRSASFASLSAGNAPQRQPSSFSHHTQQQLFTPSSSLGVSPPMRPPVPLPPAMPRSSVSSKQQQQRCSSAFPGGASPSSSSTGRHHHRHHLIKQQEQEA